MKQSTKEQSVQVILRQSSNLAKCIGLLKHLKCFCSCYSFRTTIIIAGVLNHCKSKGPNNSILDQLLHTKKNLQIYLYNSHLEFLGAKIIVELVMACFECRNLDQGDYVEIKNIEDKIANAKVCKTLKRILHLICCAMDFYY